MSLTHHNGQKIVTCPGDGCGRTIRCKEPTKARNRYSDHTCGACGESFTIDRESATADP